MQVLDVDGSSHEFCLIMIESFPLSRHVVSGNNCASDFVSVVRSQPDAGDSAVFRESICKGEGERDFLSNPSTSTSVNVSNCH